ncbi:MAG: HAD family hydrolase [bacterium]|nr:HAD family hydrolase [bacterium]
MSIGVARGNTDSTCYLRRVNALVLDFDGLILDTETAVFEAWRYVFESFDLAFERGEWLDGIGTGSASFDPMERLRSLVGPSLDADKLHIDRRRWRDEFLANLEPMPGVLDLLESARELGLRTAVASSSECEWVVPHLRRLELDHHFDSISTRDDVARAKPDPELYQHALDTLGVSPAEAIAFEDSHHGVAAARAAGIPCVAVPGPMTLEMDFSEATLVIESLGDHSLASLLERVGRGVEAGI